MTAPQPQEGGQGGAEDLDALMERMQAEAVDAVAAAASKEKKLAAAGPKKVRIGGLDVHKLPETFTTNRELHRELQKGPFPSSQVAGLDMPQHVVRAAPPKPAKPVPLGAQWKTEAGGPEQTAIEAAAKAAAKKAEQKAAASQPKSVLEELRAAEIEWTTRPMDPMTKYGAKPAPNHTQSLKQ